MSFDLNAIVRQQCEQSIQKHDLENMSSESKMALADSLHRQGVRKKQIAAYFDVNVKTIYAWLSKYNEHFLEELEAKKGIELFAEQLQAIENLESLLKYEASHMGADQIEVDPKTGERRLVPNSSKKSLSDKAKLLQLAIQCRQMQINLFTQTGLIPKQSERIYHTVSDNKIEDDSENDVSRMSKDSLTEQTLLKLYGQTNL